jgi:hypothetical protein
MDFAKFKKNRDIEIENALIALADFYASDEDDRNKDQYDTHPEINGADLHEICFVKEDGTRIYVLERKQALSEEPQTTIAPDDPKGRLSRIAKLLRFNSLRVRSIFVGTDEADHHHQILATRADTILLFICPTPDDAEAAVGDLMERFEQVRARKSWRISVAYFYWELLLLTVTKAKTRMIGATIGPLLKRFFAG